MVPLSALGDWGAKVMPSGKGWFKVKGPGALDVRVGSKRVAVDMRSQTLRAWQGNRMVFESPVSTGRAGKETPNGSFKVLDKDPDHVSSTYGSPMPWSVKVIGNIYIHGSASFYDQIGSHGCIRLPLTHGNRAKWFYDWIELGTPIRVTGSRPPKKPASDGNTGRA
jgi:lipoprotein-anchoring transpeptidase ErfK/SrfK